MRSFLKALIIFFEGVSYLIDEAKKAKHEKKKLEQAADPINSFNDKFDGVPKHSDEPPVSDHETTTKSSGEREGQG
ncbi:hypothetical protein [Pseudoalteromonas sp.]|uniref:hypothetical protein n=1 Tax=Pseudoalteromonas sp. TaxID=53249 RepID=UPI00272B5699|nr:hypothetical protein [Pseudoalteromonas sp.]